MPLLLSDPGVEDEGLAASGTFGLILPGAEPFLVADGELLCSAAPLKVDDVLFALVFADADDNDVDAVEWAVVAPHAGSESDAESIPQSFEVTTCCCGCDGDTNEFFGKLLDCSKTGGCHC